MDLYRISPYIRVAHACRMEAGSRIRERVLFDYELLYFLEGGADIVLEGTEYKCSERDLFLIKPKQHQSFHFHGKAVCTHLAVHFDLHYREDSPQVRVSYRPLAQIPPEEHVFFREDELSEPDGGIPNLLRLRNTGHIERLFRELVDRYEQKSIYYEHACSATFLLLWTSILKELYWQDNAQYATHWDALHSIKESIRMNPAQALSVRDLAEGVNFSTTYFIQLFRKFFGYTPGKYQQRMRIQQAQRLLLYSDQSISEIAERCGYRSINAFSNGFKKETGIAPTRFRSDGML